MRRSQRLACLATATAISILCSAVPAATVLAAPTVGFIEEWTGTDTHGWGGGALYDNPGTGGLFGAGDGYLRMFTPAPAKLGTFSVGDEYLGNWDTAGITQVRFWLNDVNGDEPLEIHFGIGTALSNFWQYDVGFLPPENQWALFSVDLTSSTGWTQLFGSGTFGAALQNVDRVRFRHDLAPYMATPDSIQADVGIDRFEMAGEPTGVGPASPTVSRPLELSPPYPNPSRGPVALAMRGSDSSPVKIDVVDASGRRVRHVELGGGAAGPLIWVWDGLDDSGRPVAPGAYRVRARGAGGGTSRSLVRVR